jgi:hypothetical protein
MKANDLIDTLIEQAPHAVVVELPNGQRVPVRAYRYDTDAKGAPVVVLETSKRKAR